MSNVTFSIIIPTFNAAKTLEVCIKSIICQSNGNFEILIIDGVSNDKTLEISSSFNDERIRIFSAPDKGIYDAMNKGIELARGEWLYFLGSDDELYNNEVLKRICDTLKVSKNKIIYGDVLMYDNSTSPKKHIYDGHFDLAKLFQKNICHQSIFYHHSIFNDFGLYNLKYQSLADYDFNLQCFANFKFQHVDIVVAYFKLGGFSGQFNDHNFNLDFHKNIINYYQKHLFDSAFEKKRYLLLQSFSKNTYEQGLNFRLKCLVAYIYHKSRSVCREIIKNNTSSKS